MTLDELEREAYQSGDTERAELLGTLADLEEQETETQTALDEAEERYSNVQEAWAMHNRAMREHLATLRQMIETAARVSDRDSILTAIEEAGELINEAEEGRKP